MLEIQRLVDWKAFLRWTTTRETKAWNVRKKLEPNCLRRDQTSTYKRKNLKWDFQPYFVLSWPKPNLGKKTKKSSLKHLYSHLSSVLRLISQTRPDLWIISSTFSLPDAMSHTSPTRSELHKMWEPASCWCSTSHQLTLFTWQTPQRLEREKADSIPSCQRTNDKQQSLLVSWCSFVCRLFYLKFL